MLWYSLPELPPWWVEAPWNSGIIGTREPRLAWLLPANRRRSAVWSAILLGRVSGYAPGLSMVVLVTGVVSAVGLLLVSLVPTGGRVRRVLTGTAMVLAAMALLAGPTAYDLSTIKREVTVIRSQPGRAPTGPTRVVRATLISLWMRV
jgi:hypothetical protein